jgi:hypothetical protein
VARTLGNWASTGRFVHEWVSAAEGEKFAALVERITRQVRRLGPLDWPRRMRERGVPGGRRLGPWEAP